MKIMLPTNHHGDGVGFRLVDQTNRRRLGLRLVERKDTCGGVNIPPVFIVFILFHQRLADEGRVGVLACSLSMTLLLDCVVPCGCPRDSCLAPSTLPSARVRPAPAVPLGSERVQLLGRCYVEKKTFPLCREAPTLVLFGVDDSLSVRDLVATIKYICFLEERKSGGHFACEGGAGDTCLEGRSGGHWGLSSIRENSQFR